MSRLDRITRDPDVMGGKPCIRGLRVTVGMVLGLLAAGHGEDQVLEAYPYLEAEDIRQALAYAAWRVEEQEVPVGAP
jgi:uncharacterized protein (DUF433 family)